MKKTMLLLLAAFALNSCATDDGQPEVHYELIPISRCQMPYRMTSGETYEFEMIYKMPTTCHGYKGIYFEGEGTSKTVAIQTVVYQRNDCQLIDYSVTSAQPTPPEPQRTNYEFKATAPPGSVYTFKIWTGKDDQGEDTYYNVTVPVEE